MLVALRDYVILSCLPPVVLSVTSWVVKRKFLSKDSTKENKVKVRKWSSILEDSGTKQDIGQDNLMTCNRSQQY